MVIVMQQGASNQQVDAVIGAVESEGFRAAVNRGEERSVIAVLGVVDSQKVPLTDRFESLDGVERVTLISEPYKLSSRSYRPEGTVVRVRDVEIGGNRVVVIAGPCSVENRTQMLEAAEAARAAGASLLRGGAFKPRTSPYSFQGLGVAGLELLAEAREATGLPVVTEILDPLDLEDVYRFADVFQVGARNMSNFRLLERLGETDKPVLLKRGPSAKLRDMLQAAEYIMKGGNHQVMLCERGVVGFDDACRNTTDINAIPVLKQWSHLPVILDPSHSVGHTRWVPAIARAGMAAGADGLAIEIHPNPPKALSDGGQSLRPEQFLALMEQLRAVARAVGREL
ncbi:MAG: 3-deoxy-7-phosphoheptulonate synthase [Armatimonadetes bacterium]|nr:3-deoxy-7-phosphoheptulonate synthase [Armatimonadota bacterium]